MIKHLKIKGRVQGVGYRYSMVEKADHLNIKGWVRNCPDGSVEAVLMGPPEKVDEMILWAKQGPIFATVNDVDVSDTQGEFFSFEIKM